MIWVDDTSGSSSSKNNSILNVSFMLWLSQSGNHSSSIAQENLLEMQIQVLTPVF